MREVTKEVIIKLEIPEWVDEDEVRERVHGTVEGLLASTEQSVDEARRFLGVTEVKRDIKVPENLESRILNLRRKRVWQS